ncbi:MAG: phenylacetate--CoA ligase family protein [Candidatus Omnitrophica bacterium]|nr:phenylacetate--CoA ligase family protein [Candidatus Omnitrophota bacterium]
MLRVYEKMSQFIGEALSKHLFYPLWDIKDRSVRLRSLKELNKAQWMPLEKRSVMISRKLTAIIKHAYETTRYYKELFDKLGIDIDKLELPREIESIPILRKDDIRNRTENLISLAYGKSVLLKSKTGGSTGTSLEVWADKECVERRNAAAIRSDMWAGWRLGAMRGALWGNPTKPDTLKKRLYSMCIQRVEVLDTITMNDATLSAFANTLQAKAIKHLFGHSHSLFLFADYCLFHKISLVMESIVATSMMLIDNERRIIEDAFQCKVQNRYGCEEVSLIASECSCYDGLHVNTDHVFVEIIKDDGIKAQHGEMGRIIVTDLINYGMPFIRYEVGDYGVMAVKKCSCGRTLPLLEKVVGRVADFLIKKDGTKVAGISLIERTLTKVVGIKQMQIIQDKIDCLIVKIVHGDAYSSITNQRLIDELAAVFQGVKIDILTVEKIDQDKNGKYRFAVCNL